MGTFMWALIGKLPPACAGYAFGSNEAGRTKSLIFQSTGYWMPSPRKLPRVDRTSRDASPDRER
jgi:hypothetical protein